MHQHSEPLAVLAYCHLAECHNLESCGYNGTFTILRLNDETNFIFSPLSIHSLLTLMSSSNGQDLRGFFECGDRVSTAQLSNFYSDILESIERRSRKNDRLLMSNNVFLSEKVHTLIF
jgi:hypothetical protein